MAFQSALRILPIERGSTGTQRLPASADFRASGTQARAAAVILQGFRFDYDNTDHHITVIEVNGSVTRVAGTLVEVEVVCQYADRNFDDPFGGSVTISICADVI